MPSSRYRRSGASWSANWSRHRPRNSRSAPQGRDPVFGAVRSRPCGALLHGTMAGRGRCQFGVEPQILRYGKGRKGGVSELWLPWSTAGARERQVIDAFLALPPKRRELVGELVAALAQKP